ncbi:MAG: hypothetical protein J5I93_27830 [Pirellulaceae bacterium]|nr:hypothetical protein [Pirellulaceae bacterium]
MKAQALLLAILVSALVLCWSNRADAENHPIKSRNSRVWEVQYGESEPQQDVDDRGYRAAWLWVKMAAQNDDGDSSAPIKMRATLYRFGEPIADPNDPDKKVYPLLTENQGGKVELIGNVARASRQGNNHLKRGSLRFALVGVYTDENNLGRVVKVLGTYHCGRDNRAIPQNARSDDRVTFVVVDEPIIKPPASVARQRLLGLVQELTMNPTDAGLQKALFDYLAMHFGSGSGVPCDDAPPMDSADETEITFVGMEPEPDTGNFVYYPEP